MTFEQALIYLKEWHSIRRKPWPNNMYIRKKDNAIFIYIYDTEERYDLTSYDIFAEDWEIEICGNLKQKKSLFL